MGGPSSVQLKHQTEGKPQRRVPGANTHHPSAPRTTCCLEGAISRSPPGPGVRRLQEPTCCAVSHRVHQGTASLPSQSHCCPVLPLPHLPTDVLHPKPIAFLSLYPRIVFPGNNDTTTMKQQTRRGLRVEAMCAMPSESP